MVLGGSVVVQSSFVLLYHKS